MNSSRPASPRSLSLAHSSAALAPMRTYEELDGAQGREVFFRPERYRAHELAILAPQVTVRVDAVEHACVLRDLSQNGVGIVWPAGLPVEVGTEIDELAVRFRGFEAWRGPAKVMSVRVQGDEHLLGVMFLGPLLNVDDILHLRDVESWRAGPDQDLTPSARPWHVDGFAEFRALVADHRLFLLDASVHLAEMERSLPWQVVHGEADSPARQRLIERLRAEFVPHVLRYIYATDAALRGATPEQWERLKHFSLRHLQELFLQAPIMHRAFHKPLGYPGDFEIMRYVYERPFEGPTLFAKALHLAGTSMASPQAVRNRKDLMRKAIEQRVAASDGRPVRIASVASGPAQEIYEFFAESPDVQVPVEVVLFEQDRLALSFAQGRLARMLDGRRHAKARLVYLHDSIKRLLTDPGLFRSLAPFDLILCAGLFDYLPPSTASRLTASLFAHVAPGGELYIGNLVPEDPCRWILEQHLDWRMFNRSHAEMMEFAHRGAPDARLRILEEPERVNPFVVLHRD